MKADFQTEFAPAERADWESIIADAKLLSSAESLAQVTNSVPCIVLTLNKERQVVFKNQLLVEMLNAESDGEILGKRIGELLGCIHACESEGGCGTTQFCSECGAVKSIMQSYSQKATVVDECRITTNEGQAYNFRVWASSYQFGNKDFVIFSLVDISDEKRRNVLEKTFFHDINNVLAVMKVYSHLLDSSKDEKKASRYIELINLGCKQLFKDIASHRKLLLAENSKLEVDIAKVNSSLMIDEIRCLFSETDDLMGRKIVVDECSEAVEFTTDQSLLSRVLENMIKNALEATMPGGEVQFSCSRNENSIIFRVGNPGCIPVSVQLQMFQRSFSTKGKGRGIGTYSMKLFGEKYLKGRLWFSSSENDGTAFHLSLPLVHPQKDEE